jgi:hypothetical protein
MVAVLLAGCHKEEPAPKSSGPPPTPKNPEAQAQQEAEFLGHDVFETVDLVMSFKSSHQGRLPKSLRETGLDSLTKETVRRLSVRDRVPQIASMFRRTDNRRITACRGTNDILEEASLNGGEYTIRCTLRSGDEVGFKVHEIPKQ